MNDLLEELADLGCDIEEAMPRFLNQRDFYIQYLGRFVEDLSFEELEKALEEENYEGAFRAAHKLKGVSGTLGLTPVYEEAAFLSDLLRSGEKPEEETLQLHMLHLDACYHSVRDTIRDAGPYSPRT